MDRGDGIRAFAVGTRYLVPSVPTGRLPRAQPRRPVFRPPLILGSPLVLPVLFLPPFPYCSAKQTPICSHLFPSTHPHPLNVCKKSSLIHVVWGLLLFLPEGLDEEAFSRGSAKRPSGTLFGRKGDQSRPAHMVPVGYRARWGISHFRPTSSQYAQSAPRAHMPAGRSAFLLSLTY